MQTIGLIGGMSWESTALYYKLVNERVRDRLGKLHSAPLLMYSYDFQEIKEMQYAGRWEEAAASLAEIARRLEHAGARAIVLCTNTMHKLAAEIELAITIPFVHIADTTAAAVIGDGLDRVGLLATAYTMEQDFYTGRLASHGVTVLVPEEADRALVHAVIYDELCRGIVTASSRAAYTEVIGRLAAAGAQGVILGCTEIELLVGPEDSPVPVFPTTRLHVEAAVNRALAAGSA